MLDDVKAAVERSSATMLQDALGVGALFGLVFVGLSMPGLF
jgi:hypothetical protein